MYLTLWFSCRYHEVVANMKLSLSVSCPYHVSLCAGEPFQVGTYNLQFSVILFVIVALLAIMTLILRRIVSYIRIEWIQTLNFLSFNVMIKKLDNKDAILIWVIVSFEVITATILSGYRRRAGRRERVRKILHWFHMSTSLGILCHRSFPKSIRYNQMGHLTSHFRPLN